MTSYIRLSLIAVACFWACASTGLAQIPSPPMPQPGAFGGVPVGIGQTQNSAPVASAPTTSVKLQVVLSRYQGDRKVGSEPYVMLLVPGVRGNVRSGAEVPVPTSSIGSSTGQTSYTLQQIGNQIDATVMPAPEGKYRLSLTVTDRSVLSTTQTASAPSLLPNVPSFRNTSSTSEAILSNGETIQFTSVVDKVSNETFKIEVTLTVGNK